MKKFIIFVVSMFLIYVIIVIGAKRIWGVYLPSHLKRNFVSEAIHTVVIGASNGECAWDDNIITGTKNYCSSGYTNLDTYYQLKYILDYNDTKIDTVIICQSLLNLLLYEDERYELKSTIIQSEPRALLDYSKFYATYRNSPNFYKTQVGSIRWIKSINSQPFSNGFLNLHRDKMKDANYGDIKVALEKVGGKDGLTADYIKEHCSLQVKWLEEIRNLCKEKNIVLTILCTPIYKIPDMIGENGYYNLLGKLFTKDLLIADYSRFEMPDSTYFGDPEHLNYEGAQIFSKDIAENGIRYVPLGQKMGK